MKTQHISGLVTKYKLLYDQGRAGARARVRARARYCHLLTEQNFETISKIDRKIAHSAYLSQQTI